jgi:HEAT repeat protein
VSLPLEVVFMNASLWLNKLEQADPSYLLLLALAGTSLLAGILHRIGLIAAVLRGVGLVVKGAIQGGFLLWERLLGRVSWPVFLAIAVVFLVAGALAGRLWPGLRVLFGLPPVFMGIIACLAYMFIDLERNEVERGYKAVHNPLKGQALALNLELYGRHLSLPLLGCATVALIGGFALLNQGLYETIGRDWYQVANVRRVPVYVDFVAYALAQTLGIVDVLDLFKSHHILGAASVRVATWPAKALLGGFKLFFTMVLLHQIFASLRQGKLLAETITDFWSPHEPIHERARNALPSYGALAIGPLLGSLRLVPMLTKEQRDRLPLILETIGPSIIPALVRDLRDRHAHVRAIVAAALGRLHAVKALPVLAALIRDPSEMVRQSVVEALGVLGGLRAVSAQSMRGRSRVLVATVGRSWLFFQKRQQFAQAPKHDPVEFAVATLQAALADDSTAVRIQAVTALGRIGPAAAAAGPRLIALLNESDETVRCHAATALGEVHGAPQTTTAALVQMLKDSSAPVKISATRALGAMGKDAAPAVPALVPLLQDSDESVRTAAAEAIAQVGPLDQAATDALVLGLNSADNVVRAQTAEALGTIGASADGAAPALVHAMADDNDRVRAMAVEALGKIGECAAEVAVPGLMRALRDQDNGVSALAAEALGEMGESADGAIPALVDSLSHLNAVVRRNAAEALGRMGGTAASARPALEKTIHDVDGGVRSEAIRALGPLGMPSRRLTPMVVAALQDPDPVVRAAAVQSLGHWGEPSEADLEGLICLLSDANDQVKVEVTKVLPKLAGARPAVIEGLCRRLLEDDSDWVQVYSALALGQLGRAAGVAGGPLLHAVQNGVESVRRQAMRAIAKIQPPETPEALAAGLKDACGDVRMLASAGWMNATAIEEQAISALVEALGDPEVRVRANCAHALARLDAIPAAAIPLLVECTFDADDGLRMNAAMALSLAPTGTVSEVMQRLVADPNSRVRLIAARSLLSAESSNPTAGAVLREALEDPALRVRGAAHELVESLGASGAASALGLRNGEESRDDSAVAVRSEQLDTGSRI